MTFEFFLAMNPPTVTYQEKQVRVVNGKPVFYEPPKLAGTRTKLTAFLGQVRTQLKEPFTGPVELVTKWCFPAGSKHSDGEYRTSRPDTDNLQKLLKDCMTAVGYWTDDALVCREITEKFWARNPGIYIRIADLGD